jgi:hypothetical protein
MQPYPSRRRSAVVFSKLRPRLSYANVVSTLCLFVVLGGTATAAVVITGKNVKDGSLTGRDVRDNSLPQGDTGVPGPKGDPGERGSQG